MSSSPPPSDPVSPPPPPSDPVSPPPPTTSAPPPTPTSTPPPPTATTSPPPPDTPSPPPPTTTTPASPPPSSTPSPPPPTTTTPVTPPPSSTPSPPPPTKTPVTPPSTTPSPPPPSSITPSPPSSTPSPPPPSTPAPPPSTPGTSPPPTPSSSDSSPPPPSDTTPSPPTSTTPSPPGVSSPPPPSPSSSSDPSPPPPPISSSSASPDNDGASTGLVVGVVVGGVVILAVLGLLIFFLVMKKRRRRRRRRDDHGAESFYTPHPGSKNGGPPHGGGAGAQANQSHPHQPDEYIIPKPTTHLAGMALSHQHHQSPFMSSSGGSGSVYSGSDHPPLPPPPGMVLGFSKNMFTYEELAMATDGFSDANLLGQGGFGYVHKGVLPTGKEVAVKSLKSGSGQGEREFQAEVEIISRVHHKHLVSLVGYCITGSMRMLVYEFVPNDTLEFHLHGKNRPTLDWLMRMRIALGAAKGLAYLHEDCHPKIIHRDIKGSNILVDFKFEAKVADFGLAKLCSDFDTHISTRVMGTFGYLAPEYASSGKLTEKSDVFSFGVVLLELISGRRPISAIQSSEPEDSLVDWARPLLSRALEDENLEALVDERLQQGYYDHEEMVRMVNCAAACVRHSARRRPRMSQIVRALEGDVSLSDLNEGIRPGHSTVYGSYGGSTDGYDSSQYREDMKKFNKAVFAAGSSQEYGSSEYGGTTTSSEGQMTREMETGGRRAQPQRGTQGGFSGTTTTSSGGGGEQRQTSTEQR